MHGKYDFMNEDYKNINSERPGVSYGIKKSGIWCDCRAC